MYMTMLRLYLQVPISPFVVVKQLSAEIPVGMGKGPDLLVEHSENIGLHLSVLQNLIIGSHLRFSPFNINIIAKGKNSVNTFLQSLKIIFLKGIQVLHPEVSRSLLVQLEILVPLGEDLFAEGKQFLLRDA